jgi:hypothetical protein
LFISFSSKVFAMANAAGHLRSNETKCGDALHNHLFGLDGSVTGKHGVTLLGDLATIICSYDETAGYTSNSLSSYFHDIGWRGRANGLVQNWLLIGGNTTTTSSANKVSHKNPAKNAKQPGSDLPQTLGGNYGEASPSDLTLTVTSTSSASNPEQCAADKDPWPVVYSNSLSALSAAEMVRRIALHRELPQELQYPGAVWKDIQVREQFTYAPTVDVCLLDSARECTVYYHA